MLDKNRLTVEYFCVINEDTRQAQMKLNDAADSNRLTFLRRKLSAIIMALRVNRATSIDNCRTCRLTYKLSLAIIAIKNGPSNRTYGEITRAATRAARLCYKRRDSIRECAYQKCAVSSSWPWRSVGQLGGLSLRILMRSRRGAEGI
jgi:hypothetical protein